MSLDHYLAQELERIRAADLYRSRRIIDGGHGAHLIVDGRRCINFCSNDYLGLAGDARVAQAARKALDSGTGSGAAALVSGYNREHAMLEEELAAYLQRPRALLFSSGWAANLGVLRALLGKNDVLIGDELNHASLIDGGRLSGARYVRVAHANAGAFEQAVSATRLTPDTSGLTLVATDSLFSMDGDLAPLSQLGASCAQHGAALMVDDAHGFGVLGGGRGALFETATPLAADIYMAGFGKALGTAGAVVAGSEALIEFLVQRARTWIFSTAPPPALAAATRAALAIIAGDDGAARRAKLTVLITRFRAGCRQLGVPLSASETSIQPVILGDAARAVAVSRALFERGYWVAAIRPPTVAMGTSRLRITLTAAHSEAELDGLLVALAASLVLT